MTEWNVQKLRSLVLTAVMAAGLIHGTHTPPAAAQDGTSVAAPAAPSAPARRASGTHYIEFRVASIGAYGHSYVAYGRLNAAGKPAETNYADLHPTGGYVVMALGHLVPVPANTVWDPGVLALPVASSFRKQLTATEYRKLQAAVRSARANKNPIWNAVTNNCNHFVAKLAQAVGLRTPADFQLAYSFVPALRDLNR